MRMARPVLNPDLSKANQRSIANAHCRWGNPKSFVGVGGSYGTLGLRSRWRTWGDATQIFGILRKAAVSVVSCGLQIGQRLRGGQNVLREFGGGGNVLQSVLSKTTFGGVRNWGWSGRCLFLLREMTESRQKRRGETYRRWGSKNVFGEGFFAEFTVCFPPPCFPPPLAALWPNAWISRRRYLRFGPGLSPSVHPLKRTLTLFPLTWAANTTIYLENLGCVSLPKFLSMQPEHAQTKGTCQDGSVRNWVWTFIHCSWCMSSCPRALFGGSCALATELWS